MTAGHLIADRNLTLLSDINADFLKYARCQFIAIIAAEYLYIYNLAGFAMRYSQGGITNLTGLLAEYCSEETFLSSKLSLSLWSYLTYQNITRQNLCTLSDDTILIQVS